MAADPEPLPYDVGPLWTMDQVARFLGVSPRKVAYDVSSGNIPCRRLPGGHPRFRPEEIREWFDMGCPSAADFERLYKKRSRRG